MSNRECPNFKDMRAFGPLILVPWEFPVGHWTFRYYVLHSWAHQCFPRTEDRKAGLLLAPTAPFWHNQAPPDLADEALMAYSLSQVRKMLISGKKSAEKVKKQPFVTC
jgi:hypothetical protein